MRFPSLLVSCAVFGLALLAPAVDAAVRTREFDVGGMVGGAGARATPDSPTP
ncbi:MAG: hypothetical protein JNL92_20135 [Opitutaceae bacterium]|nr:hypothetical protein [Opitutaceae bacterium]